MNNWVPSPFTSPLCSICTSSFFPSPSLPSGHHITCNYYPKAMLSSGHILQTTQASQTVDAYWHLCACSLSPECPGPQFLPAGTLVILQVCHYLHPTDFHDHPGVTTDPSPLHVSIVFCIHHFALKFPIPGSPTTSELHLPEGRSHLLFILEASYIGLNSVPPQIQVFPRTPECNLMWK